MRITLNNKNFNIKDDGIMDEILVSILCITYNHGNYISEALESFLMQKTDFKYEVLIHDDASTDKTADIIRQYEGKYPDLIKPIYQIENQFSKGGKVGSINRDRAIGKYYALCEGDDYWSDPYKLQKQVDFLEKNPDYSLCTHATLVVDSDSKKTISTTRPSLKNQDFSIEEVIEGGGGFFATNSMVYRSDMGSIRPDFYYKNKFSFGDYQLMILLAMIGKVYYIDEFMSVYRTNVPGSWTSRNRLDTKKSVNHYQEVNTMLDMVNKETKYLYNDIIKKTKEKNEFGLLIHQRKLKEAKSGIFKKHYNSLDFKSKILINLKYYSPNVYKKLFFIKRKVFNAKSKH